ncbi:MAG: hypothetical protein CM1200mP1_11150 [Candidatus Neomarinimicrobiota bacterium]|nr:MAG: hypothetical protein CM1200mP1_11150 [Candidatus Neomarinimicrobiota bacterium]
MNKSRDSNIEGANIGNQLRFSSGISLSPVRLVELIYKPSSGRSVPQRQTTRPPPVRSRTRNPGERFSEEEDIQGMEAVNRDEIRETRKEEISKRNRN